MLWLLSVIPVLGRPRQEYHEFEASLGYIVNTCLKKEKVGCRWLTPVILATQEAEIRRIRVRSQPRQIVM
jgi:hypothetical protein